MKRTAKPERVKKSGIRAIDQGTRYDTIGELRRLTRAIEHGTYGTVDHIMIGVSTKMLDGRRAVTTLGLGSPSVPEASYTVEMMKRRMVQGE